MDKATTKASARRAAGISPDERLAGGISPGARPRAVPYKPDETIIAIDAAHALLRRVANLRVQVEARAWRERDSMRGPTSAGDAETMAEMESAIVAMLDRIYGIGPR